MRFVAIDLGRKTTGIAISEGQLAQPYTTITHKSIKEAQDTIIKLLTNLNAQEVVIGSVEGKISKMFVNFAQILKKEMPKLKIILHDETLTTRQARETMIKLGIKRNRRKKKEHEVAAAIILQSYLDSHE